MSSFHFLEPLFLKQQYSVPKRPIYTLHYLQVIKMHKGDPDLPVSWTLTEFLTWA